MDIFNEKISAEVARLNLARWYNEVEAFENHNTTIINYFNAKIKAFRTQFRGVGDIKFFMFRLATLYS